MTDGDRHEVAELIYCSINYWYRSHGLAEIFRGGPGVTDVFYQTYQDLTPDCNVVAVNPNTGRLMGSCFYHPRPLHVSLGIMNVHPNYFGQGVGSALLKHILNVADARGLPLRLTQSAVNIDSFSLYNKAGCVPRYSYQDMFVKVPASGWPHRVPGDERVRPARLEDVAALAALEMEVSGITRELDYRYCITNARGIWHASVLDNPSGGVDGWIISCLHPAMNMLGPCVARDEASAAALLAREMDHHAGRAPVFLVPMEKANLVRLMYDWGAKNCEMHFCQVRGAFQPFRGVSMPSFLPESA